MSTSKEKPNLNINNNKIKQIAERISVFFDQFNKLKDEFDDLMYQAYGPSYSHSPKLSKNFSEQAVNQTSNHQKTISNEPENGPEKPSNQGRNI